jgi:dTDP-4-dehydrorhamnose reductase
MGPRHHDERPGPSAQADVRIVATGLTGMIGRRAREMWGLSPDAALQADLTDAKAVRAAIGTSAADVVVNFAAFTDVGRAQAERGDREGVCFRTNVAGPRELARACAESGKFLVQVSTDYVFEGDRDSPYAEDSSPDARSDWYGTTKRLAEAEVLAASPDSAIARIAFPYVVESPRKTDVVRRFAATLARGDRVTAFSDQVITPSFVDDSLGAILEICRRRQRGTFHLVGPQPMTPFDLAQDIARHLGLPDGLVLASSLSSFTAANGWRYPQALALSHERTSEVLGYEPRRVLQVLTDNGGSYLRNLSPRRDPDL